MTLIANAERRAGGIDFILRRGAELHPERRAIEDPGSGTVLTYEDLRARATRLARALAARGVGKGTPVAYAFFNEPAAVETLFACGMLGAVAMPLNSRLTTAEAHGYLARHGCAVLVANGELARLGDPAVQTLRVVRGGGGGEGALDYEAILAGESAAPLPPAAVMEDPYMMAMTGGTTGGPKAAVWSHGGSMLDILAVALHMEIGRRCTTICLAPTYHAAGLAWGLLPVLWQGGTVIMPPGRSFDAAFVLDTLRSRRVDYMLIVPAMIGALHDAWDGVPLAAPASMCVTSAPTPERQRRRLAAMFPDTHILAGYGMTETFSMTVQTAGEFLEHPLSVGEPSAVTRIRIVDDAGRAVPRGTAGHILGRTLGMALGYHDDEANTRRAFRRIPDDPEGLEWMDTGDIGVQDGDGRLTIVDRAKDIIVTGGENVSSVEVESVIIENAWVRECAVIGLPDERWGERVVAVLATTPAAAADEETARAVHALCRERLSAYKVPKEFVFVDLLPRSLVGKVLKRDLAGMHFERRVTMAPVRA
ncbi:AMP-binding protein [Azospirillum sp. ST 5-10]|uniref:AMP-binding protein n=1 Tax=unclassified Azospirillum TaxID=2630922 RepID=UPI003F4A5EF5